MGIMAHTNFVIIAMKSPDIAGRSQVRQCDGGCQSAAVIKLLREFQSQGAEQAQELKSCVTLRYSGINHPGGQTICRHGF